jgi:hypothetical protein
MKMKLIILLLVIFTIAIGEFCSQQKIGTKRSFFKGTKEFLKEYNYFAFRKVSYKDQTQNDIQSIENGLMIVKITYSTGVVKEMSLNYLAHNDLICNNNKCLLQYLSINSNTIRYKQLKFSFSPVKGKGVKDCEADLRKYLNQGLTCKIANIGNENPTFIIPLSEKEEDEIYFHTETNKFYIRGSLDGIEANISHFTIVDDSVTLVLDTLPPLKFEKEKNSCYDLLIKISSMLPRECPKKDTFYYFHLNVYWEDKLFDSLNMPEGGKLKIKSRDDITITSGSFTKHIKSNGILRADIIKGYLPAYEKVLWVILNNKDGYEYRFFLYYWTNDCKRYLENLLLKNRSCPEDKNSLYYYSEKYLLQGELKFNINKKIITVYEYAKNFIDPMSEKKIYVSSVKLVTGSEKLIINGYFDEDLEEKMAEKTYLMDLYRTKTCLKRFQRIEREFSIISEGRDDRKDLDLEEEGKDNRKDLDLGEEGKESDWIDLELEEDIATTQEDSKAEAFNSNKKNQVSKEDIVLKNPLYKKKEDY